MGNVIWLLGIRLEKHGDFYYLEYGKLRVRWDITTVASADTSVIRGLCGNLNGDPYGNGIRITG
jgi:hypothetical protein